MNKKKGRYLEDMYFEHKEIPHIGELFELLIVPDYDEILEQLVAEYVTQGDKE